MPEFRYESSDLKQARGVVLRTLNETGIGLIYGEPGTGVSYSIHSAVSQIEGQQIAIVYYPVCHICPRDFLKECCRLLGATPDGRGRQAMISAIREKAKAMHSQGQPLLLILDNADNLPDLVLHDMVTMISGDYNQFNLMSLLLCGTGKLKSLLQQSDNLSLRREVSYFYRMKGLEAKEVEEYVKHKLQAAGATRSIITDDALKQVYDLCARGNCKEIDNLMRTALQIGSLYNREVIDVEVMRAAVSHLNNL